MTTPGRNETCPCGSGKKYKRCCAHASPAKAAGLSGRGYAPSAPPQRSEHAPEQMQLTLQQARLLFQGGKIRDAEKALRHLLLADPMNLQALDMLSVLLAQDDRLEEAAELLQLGATLAPSRFLDNLTAVLWSSGRKDEAAVCAVRALELNPDSKHANAILPILRLEQSGRGGQLLHSIREKFDRNAAGYDESREKIGYPTPKMLQETVSASIPGRMGRVLDLGCGTGLGGEAFRESATFLAGVDASENMIRLAREKATYDSLDVSGILEYLRNTPAASWDVIFASVNGVEFPKKCGGDEFSGQ